MILINESGVWNIIGENESEAYYDDLNEACNIQWLAGQYSNVWYCQKESLFDIIQYCNGSDLMWKSAYKAVILFSNDDG